MKCEFGQVYILQVVQVSTLSSIYYCERLAVTTSSGRCFEVSAILPKRVALNLVSYISTYEQTGQIS